MYKCGACLGLRLWQWQPARPQVRYVSDSVPNTAMSARCRISSTSLRRWAEDSVDLLMAFPLFLFSELLPTGDGEQILRDHTPAHIAFESTLSFIKSASHGEGMCQMPDGRFDPGTPAHGALEPAMLLLLRALTRHS